MVEPGFAVDVVPAQGAVIVRVTGEIDLATSPRLRAALESATDQAEVIRVDMSGVTFLDSSGISVLVEAQQRLHESPNRLVLHGVGDSIRRVLEISGLGSFFELSDQPAN